MPTFKLGPDFRKASYFKAGIYPHKKWNNVATMASAKQANQTQK